MRPDQRIVSKLPLANLWDAAGSLTLRRQRAVGQEQIAEMLRRGAVRFVLANCGKPLSWVALEDCHRFWKEEVKPHLVEPDAAEIGFQLEDFPDSFCFIGSQWGEDATGAVVLLETYD